jgi:hypothetical protein
VVGISAAIVLSISNGTVMVFLQQLQLLSMILIDCLYRVGKLPRWRKGICHCSKWFASGQNIVLRCCPEVGNAKKIAIPLAPSLVVLNLDQVKVLLLHVAGSFAQLLELEMVNMRILRCLLVKFVAFLYGYIGAISNSDHQLVVGGKA